MDFNLTGLDQGLSIVPQVHIPSQSLAPRIGRQRKCSKSMGIFPRRLIGGMMHRLREIGNLSLGIPMAGRARRRGRTPSRHDTTVAEHSGIIN